MDIDVLSRSQLRTKHILLAFKEVLYQNGVNWFRCGHRKRKTIHSPNVTLISSTILMVRELAFLLIKDKTWLFVLSDYAPNDNLWGHWHLMFGIWFFYFFSSTLYHMWFYYHNNRDYMIGFDGDDNEEQYDITTLNMRTKIMIKLLDMTLWPLGFICLGISLFSLFITQKTVHFVLFGIPWSLLLFLWGYNGSSHVVHQIFYFYYVCKYFRNQFKLINNRLIATTLVRIERKRHIIRVLIEQLDTTQRRLKDSDRFWSGILFINWNLISVTLSVELLLILYDGNSLIVKAIITFDFIEFLLYLIVLCHSCASVHYQSSQCHDCLIRVYTRLNKSLDITTKLKVLLIMEKCAISKFGFSCGKLFVITYFEVSQLGSYILAAFLKSMEMK